MSQTQGIGSNPFLQTLLGPAEKISSDRQSAASASSANAKGVTADHAQLSSAGTSLALNNAGSDVRTDKVDALRAAISAGTYNVPASATADKLIESLLR